MMDSNQDGALPAPSSAPPALPSGTVLLYRDGNWNSQSYTLRTCDYRENECQTLADTCIEDKATWVAFNLPVGTLMTLAEHVSALEGHPLWKPRHCGRVIDLIGTGSTQAVDLTQCNMTDCISSFLWWHINLQLNAFELVEHTDIIDKHPAHVLDDWPFSASNSTDR
ncbi:hypothetical protein J5J83_05505 [Azoarcus sp. L1K30]|uniref:hypothetical protein n=1 Tax=Azoarcus sp. L1K30 TaxID=2820277 RepID=UPI001B82120C|nr:hypothetical protein [Azoarcus sp. L1K30]MBR0565571.1 hypothetical protein [Azoarcus sp. L1K30]